MFTDRGYVCLLYTSPTMLNAIDDMKAKDGQRMFTPAHFDLIIIDESHRSKMCIRDRSEAGQSMRWSKFKDDDPRRIFEVMSQRVFPAIKSMKYGRLPEMCIRDSHKAVIPN